MTAALNSAASALFNLVSSPPAQTQRFTEPSRWPACEDEVMMATDAESGLASLEATALRVVVE